MLKIVYDSQSDFIELFFFIDYFRGIALMV